MDEIRECVVRGITTIPNVEVDPAAVEKIVSRIVGRRLKSAKGYAYRAGKNWALDKRRSLDAAPRIEARRLRKENAALTKRVDELEYNRRKALYLIEFDRVAAKLVGKIKPSQVRQIEILRGRIFEGRTPEMLRAEYGYSNDLVDQLKRRGVKLIWPHISEGFRDFLGCKAP